MSIDNILSKISTEVFSNLEDGERRIIRCLSLNGPLNMKEIGEFTSKYTTGFDRWGVKKRLEGTSKFRGLIDTDYLIELKVNEKESKYGLTLKGLFESLCNTKFEKNYLIKEYQSFLSKSGMKDSKLANWAIQLMKYETALILYYVKAQGLDWTRFKQTRLYMNELHLASKELLRPFYMNTELLSAEENNEFQEIKDEYLKLVITVHLITEIGDVLIYPLDREENYRNADEQEKTKIDTLRSIRDWYYKIYLIHLNTLPHFDIDFLDKLEYIPERTSDDPIEQHYTQLPKIKQVVEKLTNEGYSIEERFRDFN